MSTVVKTLSEWRVNPVKYVYDNFKADPDEWQKDVLESFMSDDPAKTRIAMAACAGPGKGHSASELALTTKGLKKYGELKIGDSVYSESGKPTKIIAVKNWGLMDFYRVTFDDGTFEEVSGEHLWKVQSNIIHSFADWKVIELKELIKLNPVKIYPGKSRYGNDRKVRRFRIPQAGLIENKPIKFIVDPYLLGAWIGDGARNSSKISSPDIEIFQEIEKNGDEITYHFYENGICPSHSIKNLKSRLRIIGIGHLYSGQRYIPEIYFNGSIEQRKQLLRGLLDTDGCAKTNGSIEFTTTSNLMVRDIVRLARSVGCKAAAAGFADFRKETSISYTVYIKFGFEPFKVKRKLSRWSTPPEYKLYKYIDHIEKIEQHECVCIEIADKSHCYLTKNLNVTHNSTALAWCGWMFLSLFGTRDDHPKAAALSVTNDNLRDNLWSELARWQDKSPFLKSQFVWNKERIYSKEFPASWFMSARSFSKTANAEEQGRALSGLHSKFILYLIDESGDISPTVLKSAEQGLSTGPVFGKILQAGNPTSHNGMLYASTTALAHLWHRIRITGDPDDPKRSPRIDINWAREQIQTYGRDNPWVMAYILGLFPPNSINSLLSPDEVDMAMSRSIAEEAYSFSQRRIGVDVALGGMDSTVLFPRQGLAAFNPIEMKNARPSEIADRLIMAKHKWDSELEFIDDTGGFGSGVLDNMQIKGYSPIGINFSSKAISPVYFNKRSEIWFLMAEWVKRGGCLPKHATLRKELLSPTFTFTNSKFVLESKEQIKKRLGFSTDYSDSLALTFSLPEAPRKLIVPGYHNALDTGKMKSDYNPIVYD